MKQILELQFLRDLTLAAPISLGREAHISAASGIVKVGHDFIVVADDELHLALFDSSGLKPGKLVQIFPGELPAKKKPRKKMKPDLESLVLLPGLKGSQVLVIPSGSKSHRGVGSLVSLGAETQVDSLRDVDFSELFASLEDDHAVKSLNIEGAIVEGEYLRLLQRGNSKDSKNMIIDLRLDMVIHSLIQGKPIHKSCVSYLQEMQLGSLDGVALSFTDATALGSGYALFTATAEATDNSYDDAPYSGSIMGLWQGRAIEKCNIIRTWKFDKKLKVEGVFAEQSQKDLDIYFVTDDDDPAISARMYYASIDVNSMTQG